MMDFKAPTPLCVAHAVSHLHYRNAIALVSYNFPQVADIVGLQFCHLDSTFLFYSALIVHSFI